MCKNDSMSDAWAASELINMMQKRSISYQLPFLSDDMAGLTKALSQYEIIITQRFHGIILSEMMGTPYISLHHHDKLKFASPMNGISLPYYGIMKQNLLDSFNKLKASQSLPIESDIFETLKREVENILSSG
jgi:polysaccharide pyruvyl transferase WcaK-like protein